ncbi:hypothetical protein BDV32DRAFT_33843 [Aspergillus pseudonomiae]|nr:hypothetical protein BDV32DRAFT_33843 [Aspergillus pseudonomiae]
MAAISIFISFFFSFSCKQWLFCILLKSPLILSGHSSLHTCTSKTTSLHSPLHGRYRREQSWRRSSVTRLG